MNESCSRCGSGKIMSNLPLSLNVYTADGGGGGTADVRVEGKPEAWIFKDPTYGGLTAQVCGECGHVELFAHNFRRLYEKYEKVEQAKAASDAS